jgi:hypothetical protein
MPLEYTFIESKKLVYLKGIGTVSFSELMNHIDELCQNPKYKPPMKKLVDHRQIKKLDLTMKEQELFAEKKAAFRELFIGEKCAIVTPTDFTSALARVHSALIEESNIDTSIFRNFNEALTWLGIELDDDELIKGISS